MQHTRTTLSVFALILFVGSVFGQVPGKSQNPNLVEMTPAEKTAIDLVSTKIENIQLKYATMQAQFQQSSAKLEADFKQQSAERDKILADARKAHGLNDNAVFNGTETDPKDPMKVPFTFTVLPVPPPPPPAPAKAKGK